MKKTRKISYGRNNKKIRYINSTLKSLIFTYKIKYDNKYNLVLLSNENAIKLKEAVKNDDDYIPFSRFVYEHYKKQKLLNRDHVALLAIIREIDRDNSTNVWRYKKKDLLSIVKYIENPKNNFFHDLKTGDINLPDKLIKNCEYNIISFASKVCKYLHEYIYNKDKYYIFDSVIRCMLLYYFDYYEIEHPNIKSANTLCKYTYYEFYDLLERLNNKRKERHKDGVMKRDDMDRIIWYCYKSYSR